MCSKCVLTVAGLMPSSCAIARRPKPFRTASASAARSPSASPCPVRHFASKEDLVGSFLELRESRWTMDWLQAEVERLAAGGDKRALAVFDVLDEWFHRPDFEGCAFINTLLEIGDPENPIHRKAIHHLEVLRSMLEEYAAQAGVKSPVEVS